MQAELHCPRLQQHCCRTRSLFVFYQLPSSDWSYWRGWTQDAAWTPINRIQLSGKLQGALWLGQTVAPPDIFHVGEAWGGGGTETLGVKNWTGRSESSCLPREEWGGDGWSSSAGNQPPQGTRRRRGDAKIKEETAKDNRHVHQSVNTNNLMEFYWNKRWCEAVRWGHLVLTSQASPPPPYPSKCSKLPAFKNLKNFNCTETDTRTAVKYFIFMLDGKKTNF